MAILNIPRTKCTSFNLEKTDEFHNPDRLSFNIRVFLSSSRSEDVPNAESPSLCEKTGEVRMSLGLPRFKVPIHRDYHAWWGPLYLLHSQKSPVNAICKPQLRNIFKFGISLCASNFKSGNSTAIIGMLRLRALFGIHGCSDWASANRWPRTPVFPTLIHAFDWTRRSIIVPMHRGRSSCISAPRLLVTFLDQTWTFNWRYGYSRKATVLWKSEEASYRNWCWDYVQWGIICIAWSRVGASDPTRHSICWPKRAARRFKSA